MLNVIQGVKLNAQCYAWIEAIPSMLYTWSEALCTLLYKD